MVHRLSIFYPSVPESYLFEDIHCSDIQELLSLFLIRTSLLQATTLGQLTDHNVEDMVIVMDHIA